MKKWPLLLIHLIEALLVLAAVYFEPTYCVRGKLRGEAFFEGRPTSYWAQELERWDIEYVDSTMLREIEISPPIDFKQAFFVRRHSWFEEQRQRWFPPVGDFIDIDVRGPTLLRGDAKDAKAVLDELLQRSSPKVVRLIHVALGHDREFPKAP
jgi:hypothetical protein